MDRWQFKSINEGQLNVSMVIVLSANEYNRFICQPSLDMFLVTWSDAWPLFLIFAISCDVMPYVPTHSIRSLKHWTTSMTTTRSFLKQELGLTTSHCQDNTHSCIISSLSFSLGHPMASALQLQSWSTSRLSRSLGTNLAGTTHFGKCYSLMYARINLQWPDLSIHRREWCKDQLWCIWC